MINGKSTNATENKITHQLVQLFYHELSPSKIHFNSPCCEVLKNDNLNCKV